jgi:DNA-binding XRE family transcriptional regulator
VALSTIIVDQFVTPSQARAARALLEMNQATLAQRAGLGLSTIVDFEKQRRQISPDAVSAIQAVFEHLGIEFIDENGGGLGVRFRKPRKRK